MALTPEQIAKLQPYAEAIKTQSGTGNLSQTQFNYAISPTEIIPAGINPGSAATVNLYAPQVAGAYQVQDLGTQQGAQTAQSFASLPSNQPTPAPIQPFTPEGAQQIAQIAGQPVAPQQTQATPQQPAPQVAQQPQGVQIPQVQGQAPVAPLAGLTLPQMGQPQPTTTAPSQTYTVAAGDTLSAIARKLGVSTNDITGFRSGDPNLIFPGETLSVTKAQPLAPLPPPQPITPSSVGGISGTQPPSQEQVFDSTLKSLGVSRSDFASMFATNPQKSIKDLVTEVMTSTGLPEVKTQISNVTKEIEDMENERDGKVREVNDNPWLSESLRSKKITKIQGEYEDRINNRTNRLKLFQDLADDARQQAQFAATLAVNQFNADRSFQEKQLEFIINAAEKAADNERALQSQDFREDLGLANLDLATQRLELQQLKGSPLSKPATGEQRQALAYYNRALAAVQDAQRVEQSIVGLGTAGQLRQQYAPLDLLRSAEGKLYAQAQRTFTEARLRKESGAAIPQSEFEADARIYFAQPGDDQAVINQKRAARQKVLSGLGFSSGNAYQEFYGEPFSPQGTVSSAIGGGTGGTTSSGIKYTITQ